MQVETYLKKYQPVIYQTFLNSFTKGHLSHAFLLSGSPGTPLLETAKFLAKSILCDDPSPLACDSCITCLRVDDNNYPDFVLFDGSKETIKKDAVNIIESSFEKKAFEAKGIRIYILHLVENMTVEAVNSILKFLEEPGSQIYAFLTTNNESNLLPTIISRCQLMRLKLIDRQSVISEAMEYGVNQDDAEFLSYFYNNGELISDILKDEDEAKAFTNAKESFVGLLEALKSNDPKDAIYYVQKTIIPTVKTKESVRFFMDMLAQSFEDMMAIKNQRQPILTSYVTILELLANKLNNIEDKLIEILKDRNKVNSNVSIALLLDHLILSITGGI